MPDMELLVVTITGMRLLLRLVYQADRLLEAGTLHQLTGRHGRSAHADMAHGLPRCAGLCLTCLCGLFLPAALRGVLLLDVSFVECLWFAVDRFMYCSGGFSACCGGNTRGS